MNAVIVRKAQLDELDSVRMLVSTAVDELHSELRISAPPPAKEDQEDWSLSLVAVAEGHIVGVALTDSEWLSDLWVLRENRRRRVGRTLLAMAEAEIAARGCQVFRLRVVKSNVSAVKFYLQNGWHVKHEFPHEKLPITMLEMNKPHQAISGQP